MKVSIFTPTHDASYLVELYESIKQQDFYEWVIVCKPGMILPEFNDQRIRRINFTSTLVGELKAMACSNCTGDILLELDHDDLLEPTAVADVITAFQDPEIGFVYSDCVRFNADGSYAKAFNPNYGWQSYRYDDLLVYESFDPTPVALSRIWYAPDHLRAWRRSVYEAIGGHNVGMRVLDDQELMCRTYVHTKMHHIPKCLYRYRITGTNSWLTHNAEIQYNTPMVGNRYLEAMALKWATDRGLRSLDLGGRFNSAPGYLTVDCVGLADFCCDLNEPWPFPDNSVGVVRAFDVFEHLKDPVHVMKELYRVLAPGGYAFLQIPSTDGRGAWQDPTHVSFWNENSILYYTHNDWAKYIDVPVRFQAINVSTTIKDEREVCWVRADLVSLKDDFRPPGLVNI